jgi:hypothetical protein
VPAGRRTFPRTGPIAPHAPHMHRFAFQCIAPTSSKQQPPTQRVCMFTISLHCFAYAYDAFLASHCCVCNHIKTIFFYRFLHVVSRRVLQAANARRSIDAVLRLSLAAGSPLLCFSHSNPSRGTRERCSFLTASQQHMHGGPQP